ncbi:MAG: hypothetical protein AMXMBFR7_08100 [Planctomycetota bacterium]
MKNVWLLATVSFLYGVAIGTWATATPQACLELRFSSEQLGLIGSGPAVGYALSCLILGQLCRGLRGKHVLLAGVAISLAAAVWMSQASDASGATAAQLLLGLAAGAFWPFCSAWMLDFQCEGISKSRILRFYNLGWTSGTMLGFLVGGWLCAAGIVLGAFLACAALFGVVLVLSLFPSGTSPRHAEVLPTQQRRAVEAAREVAHPVGWALFAAAALANLAALAGRAIVNVNYAELNEVYGYGKDRMGYLGAASLAGQMLAFAMGRWYEPYLGLRRTYFALGAVLAAVSLALAYVENLPLLLLLVVLVGFVLALAFQSGIVAATGFFASPRTGTTVHEAVVGLGTMAPLLAGVVVQWAKESGWETREALRAPFAVLALTALLIAVVQALLVSKQPERRALLAGDVHAAKAAGNVD